jgi:single-stranded-DNA-specific exonuclease
VFGDSDVDGLSASVILHESLRAAGAQVQAWHSNRIDDGYGFPTHVIQQLHQAGITLFLLADCGTNQPDEIAELAACGIDTIVLDHHVPKHPAKPLALVNPHVGAGVGAGLCSAGLALKLAEALAGDWSAASQYLDLAALATLADCAPLTGDNRIIVTLGLRRIVNSRRPGLQRLCELAGAIQPEPETILRKLTPRLNANGRLGDAAAVWRLLHADGQATLDEDLDANHAAYATTKDLGRQTLAQAEQEVSRLHFRDRYVLFVSRPDWHQGMMGPLASQLARCTHAGTCWSDSAGMRRPAA